MRLISIVLVILFLLLQHRLWFGKNSVLDYNDLKDQVTKQLEENKTLKQRNKILYADIDDLKAGKEAIEERARNELGMIKENETFFRIIPTTHKARNKESID